jgi:hypothetical protein
MSKLGVGVGEEFPVDEPKPDEGRPPESNREGAPAGKTEDEDYARYRAWREQRRREHDEWHARKRAFKEEVRKRAREFREEIRQRAREHFGDDYHFDHYRRHGVVLRVLGLAALAGLAIALLPHLFLLIALALVVIFLAAHYHHHHYHSVPFHDADA